MFSAGGDSDHLTEVGVAVGVIGWDRDTRLHRTESAFILRIGVGGRVMGIEDLPTIRTAEIIVDNQLLAGGGGGREGWWKS